MARKKKVIQSLDSTDVIAILIIAGGFILMAFHIDTVVGGVITMTAGYYFGRKNVNSKK